MPTMNHEDHERITAGCPECDEDMEALVLDGNPLPRAMTRAEREEMEADRELMRDEFHR